MRGIKNNPLIIEDEIISIERIYKKTGSIYDVSVKDDYSILINGIFTGNTHPHMPPVEPLIAWAKRKLRLNEKEAESAGWAIAIKIKNEGSEPSPFIRPAADFTKMHFAGKYKITIK